MVLVWFELVEEGVGFVVVDDAAAAAVVEATRLGAGVLCTK